MKQILLESRFGTNFRDKYIPKVLLGLLNKDLKDSKNNYMFSYIKDNYNISKNEIIDLMNKNLQVHKFLGNTTIYFDNNIYINKDVKLISILELIDSGNLNVRGTNLFSNRISYILDNKFNLYRYYNFNALKKKKGE